MNLVGYKTIVFRRYWCEVVCPLRLRSEGVWFSS